MQVIKNNYVQINTYFYIVSLSIELFLLFFLIALFYASVGFGGGSSYLAILSLFGIDFLTLRSTALLCNITVVGSGTYIFNKHKLINWAKVLPLIICSIPMAYLGGRMRITENVFFVILAIALILAGAFMLWQAFSNQKYVKRNNNRIFSGTIGGLIGFFSGMIGIGGGIFLAPTLHFINWDKPKVIAATASLFILLNSIAGLIGQISNPNFTFSYQFALPLIIAVFVGGQIGTRLNVMHFKPNTVRVLTAILIAFVGVRILIKYLI